MSCTTVLGEETYRLNISRLVSYSLIFTVAALWLLHRRQRQTKLYKLGNKLPGPMALPLFGNALQALGKRTEDVVRLALGYSAQYGDVIRAWLGPKLFVFLTDPNDVEVILNSQLHIDKSDEYELFKPWLGEGLLISTGSKWRTHRRMIAPTFHINILKSFVDIFNQNSKNVVEKMMPEVGKCFDVHDYMSGVTVDILLETAMGITRKTQDESGFDYAMAVMKMCDIIHQRHYKFWLRLDFTFKFTSFFKKQHKLLSIIHGLTNKVIRSKKETYLANKAKGIVMPTIEQLTETKSTDNLGTSNKTLSDNVFKGIRDDLDFIDENDVAKGIVMPTIEQLTETKSTDNLGTSNKTLSDNVFKGIRDDLDFIDENDVGEKKRLAFLDLMIESIQSGTNIITDHEIKEQVDTIMFEGHDTTAAGSSFVLCLLGVYQNIQTRVYDELYNIFEDSDRPATFADTIDMKYLERVILETLRLYPPVPAIARKLKQDVLIPTNNYVIPAGATVVIGTFKIHRHEKYYDNPTKFNPDNFLPENTNNRHYYSYIPFSAGPRSCVGRKYAMLKLKILLSTILRNYKVISEIPEDNFALQADIILKRSDGFRIKLEHRKRMSRT